VLFIESLKQTEMLMVSADNKAEELFTYRMTIYELHPNLTTNIFNC